jgi:predicted metal-dependent peptidase
LTQISNRKLWRKAINHSASLCAADDSWTECLLSRDRRDASPFGRRRDETHQHLVVVIDTSGSVVDSVNRFCGAIEVALRRENLTCDLILCHDQVSGHYRNIRSFKKLKINGATGGTDLRQAIKFISESSHYRKMRKIHVVMITDGYTPWNGVPDRFVLTCIYTPQHAALAGVRYSALIHQ